MHIIFRDYTEKQKLSILIATFWDYPHTGGLSNYIKTLSEGLKKEVIRWMSYPQSVSFRTGKRIAGGCCSEIKRFL